MAVAATNLTTVAAGLSAASYTTGSTSPGANNLELLSVYSIAAATPNIPTITWNGATWTQVATQIDSSSLRRITLFRSLTASPTSGTGTIAFGGQTQMGVCWSYIECTGMNTSGTNGAGAIVQSVTNNTAGNATSLTVTLAAFSSASNATFGAFGIPLNTASQPTAGSGFTRLGQANQASTNTAIGTEFNSGNDTTVDMTSGAASIPWVGIAVEIKVAGAVTPTVTYQPYVPPWAS